MDLSDYLYLIIILGAALFQIVSKSLGNKSVKKIRDHEKNEESLKRTPKKEKIIPDIPQQVVVNNQPIVTQQANYTPVESTLVCESARSNPDANESDSKPLIKDNCFESIEEVRKAIIYNEILNRKY
ncbi:MAG: hypothetical protein ACRCX5_13510 [Bacteroidales bacterium]